MKLKQFFGRKSRDSDPDPQLFELLDPDPHTNCGSGSRREKNYPKKGKRTEFSSFEVLDVHF
jgi:hypothetical protein